jgi:hypothetical protein
MGGDNNQIFTLTLDVERAQLPFFIDESDNSDIELNIYTRLAESAIKQKFRSLLRYLATDLSDAKSWPKFWLLQRTIKSRIRLSQRTDLRFQGANNTFKLAEEMFRYILRIAIEKQSQRSVHDKLFEKQTRLTYEL